MNRSRTAAVAFVSTLALGSFALAEVPRRSPMTPPTHPVPPSKRAHVDKATAKWEALQAKYAAHPTKKIKKVKKAQAQRVAHATAKQARASPRRPADAPTSRRRRRVSRTASVSTLVAETPARPITGVSLRLWQPPPAYVVGDGCSSCERRSHPRRRTSPETWPRPAWRDERDGLRTRGSLTTVGQYSRLCMRRMTWSGTRFLYFRGPLLMKLIGQKSTVPRYSLMLVARFRSGLSGHRSGSSTGELLKQRDQA